MPGRQNQPRCTGNLQIPSQQVLLRHAIFVPQTYNCDSTSIMYNYNHITTTIMHDEKSDTNIQILNLTVIWQYK